MTTQKIRTHPHAAMSDVFRNEFGSSYRNTNFGLSGSNNK